MKKEQLTGFDRVVYYTIVIFSLGIVYALKVIIMKAIEDTRK